MSSMTCQVISDAWLSSTPSGKRFSVEHVHIYRVEDHQLAEHWVVRDDLGMMLQLDALPV
jgi:predicted ester cyclase